MVVLFHSFIWYFCIWWPEVLIFPLHWLEICSCRCNYTPLFNEVERGYTGFTLSIRLSVCGQNRVRSASSTILAGSISYCNQKQTLEIQSPTSRRPNADRLPIAPQLIADWLLTDRRRVDNHCRITRHYSINTRSLSAPEPILVLFSVTSSDIKLKAISWRQFYKRYFKHRSLKIDLKITHLIFRSNLIIDCLVWNIQS